MNWYATVCAAWYGMVREVRAKITVMWCDM